MSPHGLAALATAVGGEVVDDTVLGTGRVVVVVDRAAGVVVEPAPVRPDGPPPHEATTSPTAAQSTAARSDLRFVPALVISPPGAA